MTSNDLLTEIDGPVARLIFNRPASRNAATRGMLADMHSFLEVIADNRAVRCIVMSGTGEHFMAGGDVAGFGPALNGSPEARRAEFLSRVEATAPLFLQLAKMPQPIIARVRGAVAGAALGFVAGSDFVLCGTSAVFVLAHVKIGASPDGSSSYYLPRLVGARKAKELAILGERIGASEALALGIANRVVPDLELDTAVETLVKKIVAAPAESVRRAKSLMDRSLANTLQEQLALEAESFAACTATDDFVEGVRAFGEKRPAVFNKSPP